MAPPGGLISGATLKRVCLPSCCLPLPVCLPSLSTSLLVFALIQSHTHRTTHTATLCRQTWRDNNPKIIKKNEVRKKIWKFAGRGQLSGLAAFALFRCRLSPTCCCCSCWCRLACRCINFTLITCCQWPCCCCCCRPPAAAASVVELLI